MVGLLKRRPGMSVEEFRAYYEKNHRVIGEKYLSGHAVRYMRRFLDPAPNHRGDADEEPEYDVILEIWYTDRAAYDASRTVLSAPEVLAEIVEDEEKLFDRSSMRFYVVEEHESDLTT
jgi:hypothetical protein